MRDGATSSSNGYKQLRTEARITVMLAAELRTSGGALGCRVRDISRGGACVDADRAQPVGARIAFHRAPLAVQGIVVWARGARLGLRFDAPIRATDLFVQLSHSREAQAGTRTAPVTRAPVKRAGNSS